MPDQLLQGRILHVSGNINSAYNLFDGMDAGEIQNPGGTLSGELNSGDCDLTGARFLQR